MLSLGSASATALHPLHKFKPALLALTAALVADKVRRVGLTRQTLLRSALPLLILLVPKTIKAARPTTSDQHHRGCH